MSTGLFITFEGGEGSGKTTQINRLTQALLDLGRKVITTREPGGTPGAEKIRDLLVKRDGGDWNPSAEILLLFAARIMHVEKVIRPALESGKIVICDRFTDSTRAYQGYGHQTDIKLIETINKAVLGDFAPDLTFVLDIDPKIGLERSERRLAALQLPPEEREDRFESLDLAFHERLRDGFLQIAKNEPKRCRVINADQDIEAMSQEILKVIKDKLA